MGIDRNVGGGPDAIMVKDDEGIKIMKEKEVDELISNISKEKAFSVVSEAFKDLVKKAIKGKSEKVV